MPYEIMTAREEIREKYRQACCTVLSEYEQLCNAGIGHDSAGYPIPQGLRNVLIIGATPYQWKHMIGQRVCRRNTDETRLVMLMIIMGISLIGDQLRVLFGDESSKVFDFQSYAQHHPRYKVVLTSPERFNSAMLTSDGYGVTWGDNLYISYLELYRSGQEKSMNLDEIKRLFQYRVINSAEAAELLNCTRQNIEDLVRRDRLFPVKTMPKGKLFLKGEVESRRKG